MAGIRIEPISAGLGAEISGVDLTAPLDAETARAIEQAWYDHLVILIRGQDITLDQQRAFAGCFGTVGKRGGTKATALETKTDPGVMLVTNVRENGKPIGTLPDGEMMFHSDTPYVEHPQKATLLYAMEVPSWGGHTLFSNSYAAAEALPDDIKQRLAGRRAMQVYDYGTTIKTAAKFDRAVQPHFAHPVFRRHPETGRSALFVSELMTEEIVGLDEAESREILDFLFAHQRRAEFIYEHVWRPGDLVMWDNRCSVHARTDFPPDQRRMLRRLTLDDEHPVLAGDPPMARTAAE